MKLSERINMIAVDDRNWPSASEEGQREWLVMVSKEVAQLEAEFDKLVRYVREAQHLITTFQVARPDVFFHFSMIITEIEDLYQALSDETRKEIEDGNAFKNS